MMAIVGFTFFLKSESLFKELMPVMHGPMLSG
jgi:hypothetical protein